MIAHHSRQTIGSVLDRQKGFGAGFDVLRWLLAFVIFYGHCKWLAGAGVPKAAVADAVQAVTSLTERGWSGYRRPFQVSLVPMFFALSGFLVMASAMRVREVRGFLGLRALRIFPALTVEVALSALILGPLLTSLTLTGYFTDTSFFSYFGNIVGVVQLQLPGVFDTNPVPGIVNANLWTLPAEFYCYLMAAVAMATGCLFHRVIITAIYGVASIVLVAMSIKTGFGLTETTASTIALVYYFATGGIFYLWRDTIARDLRLFAVAAVLAYGLLYIHATLFLAAIPVAYVTVYLGLFHHQKLTVLRKADYSYGIYLYGFPITQALLAVMPSLHGHGNVLALLATVVTLTFAALSWHLIEAPMLALKSYVLRRKTAGSGSEPVAAVGGRAFWQSAPKAA